MLSVIMLSVVMLSVIMLSVVMLSVVMENVIMENVVLENVIMENVIMKNVVKWSVFMVNVVMWNVVAPQIEGFPVVHCNQFSDWFSQMNPPVRHDKIGSSLSCRKQFGRPLADQHLVDTDAYRETGR